MRVLQLIRPAQPSIADTLHALALRLQPLIAEWHAVRREMTVAPAERSLRLTRLEREANRAGMVEMHRLLRHLCRQYCSARNTSREGRFDLEAFEEEVLLLLHERLPRFDPRQSRFSTWLSNYVLQEAFSNLQRSVNPRWGRPAPLTERGRQQRWAALQLARAVSAHRSAGSGDDALPDLLETIPDGRSGTGDSLLEQQCRELFLQAVDRLSAADQLLLDRIFLRGELKQDVARSMGRSPGRISQKLGEIKKRLAELLGPDFNDECGDTSFCRGAGCAGREGQDTPCPQAAGATFARLSEAIPELLARSGWPGVLDTLQPYSDPSEQARWEALMASPVPSEGREWWILGTIAAGIAVLVLVGRARPPEAPSPPTLANNPPSQPERPAPEQPPVRPPQKTAPRTATLPDTAPSRRNPPKTAPAPRPKRALQHTPPATTPRSTPRLNEPLVATGPESTVMRGSFDDAVRSYAGALCRALGRVPLQPGTEGPTVLSVPVVVAEGQVRLDEVPEVLLSGGTAQDEALLGALQALQMPEWPQGKPGTVRLLVTFDANEKQPLDCRPE